MGAGKWRPSSRHQDGRNLSSSRSTWCGKGGNPALGRLAEVRKLEFILTQMGHGER